MSITIRKGVIFMTCEICQAQEKLYKYKAADGNNIYVCLDCYKEFTRENRERYEFKKILTKTLKNIK